MKFEELIAYEKKESRAEGKAEAVIELLEELGYVPDELRNEILSEGNIKLLSKWLKLAAKASSVEEFEQSYEI